MRRDKKDKNDSNDQLKELKKETKIAQEKEAAAKAELEIAKSKKEAREINLPKGDTKALEGTIDADDKFGYLSELVAYHAMKSSAEKAGEQIKKSQLPPGSRILIVDQLNFAEKDFSLMQINNQFSLFQGIFDKQIKENKKLKNPPMPEQKKVTPTAESAGKKRVVEAAKNTGTKRVIEAVSTASGIISAIADIVGYFKVDYSIKGQDFKLDSDAMAAIVAGKISDKYNVHIINFNMVSESSLLKELEELIQKRKELDESKELLSKEEEGESAIKESTNILKVFDAFIDSIMTTEKDQSQPLIVSAMVQEHIRKMVITHLLYLEISSSGGEAITEKRIFSSGHTAYIGGGTVTYILADKDGKVISSDSLVAFSEMDYKIDSSVSPKIRVVKLP